MDTVRRKYADAMRFLRGAPLAKVDVLVDPGVKDPWTHSGQDGQGRVDEEGRPGQEGRESLGKGEVRAGDGNVTAPATPSGAGQAQGVPGKTTVKPNDTDRHQRAVGQETDKVLKEAPDVAVAVSNTDNRHNTTRSLPSSPGQEKRDRSHVDSMQSDRTGRMGKRGMYDSPAIPLKSWIQGWMDVLYYGDVRVGEPEQVMGIDFDTGSADLWVRPDSTPSDFCLVSEMWNGVFRARISWKGSSQVSGHGTQKHGLLRAIDPRFLRCILKLWLTLVIVTGRRLYYTGQE